MSNFILNTDDRFRSENEIRKLDNIQATLNKIDIDNEKSKCFSLINVCILLLIILLFLIKYVVLEPDDYNNKN